MSGSNGISDGLVGIVGVLVRYYAEKAEERRALEEKERGLREQQAYEEQVARQVAQWRMEVDVQRAHGDAGDATEREAIAALGGRGFDQDGGYF